MIKNCEPLYLSKPFLKDGHTSEKANGTITYVKFRQSYFGLTCSHINNMVNENNWLTVFGENRIIYQFGRFTQDGYLSNFVNLRMTESNFDFPDIAITRLNLSYYELHMKHKKIEFIDLNNWIKPEWHSIKFLVATGYPTEHKIQAKDYVGAPLLDVVAEVTDPLFFERDSFLLASTLEFDNKFFFSGMSGGPVYFQNPKNSKLTLVGIVYEGLPGSSNEWANRNSQSFYTKKDIQIHAHTLTPAIFQKWLEMAKISC
jgi:hypothetical protein